MMHVRLVSHSRPTAEFEQHGIQDAQELVAYCARVSNPANQFNTDTSERLIQYLIRHQHWSPLEMVSACLEITTTRDIARQMLRHRSFSFQEFSQRYADPTRDLDFEYRELRFQDTQNRQASSPMDMRNSEHRELARLWLERQQAVIRAARDAYTWAVDNGIAREQARAVLPEGNTVSRLYMNGTLRSWVHFIELRTGNGTQREHADIARVCAEVIGQVFPMVTEFVHEDRTA
jgi:thymidylate synthase (FAD)